MLSSEPDRSYSGPVRPGLAKTKSESGIGCILMIENVTETGFFVTSVPDFQIYLRKKKKRKDFD